ncbi:hypothetical protein EV05_1371 [Prochlorococcus sp. MIT 0601]|nr:hypothetical protein EV05_1371 [Prochlorococcus sp. MIT 0601]
MFKLFSVALGLNPLEIAVIIIAGLGFLLMFGISSAKGGYQDLIKTTLDNDERKRQKRK